MTIDDRDAGAPGARIARFGPYSLDLDRGELWKDDQRVELRPKPTRVLVALVENAGSLVSHDELSDAGWGEDHTIIDSSLHTTISQVRDALDDEASSPRFVQTVHRRGYRFVSPVTVEQRPATGAPGSPEDGSAATSRLALAIPALAAAIIAAILLAVVLVAPGDETASAAEPTDAVLQGRYLITRGSPGDFQNGREILQRAVEGSAADSPLAWAGLARAELRRWDFDAAVSAARRALRLDPDQADALAVLGEIDVYLHRDWERAERHFVRSLTLEPDAPAAHGGYAAMLAFLGRSDEAVREARLARRQAPLSMLTNVDLAWILNLARRHEEAAAQARATLELDPDYGSAHAMLHAALAELGDEAGARDALIESLRINGAEEELLAAVRAAEPAAGLERGYAWLRAGIESTATERQNGHVWTAVGYMLQDNPSGALEALDRAVERDEPLLPMIAADPRFDPLRDEPRFRRILAGLGLPVDAPAD